MKKFIKVLTNIENGIMVATFATMVICSFAQVVNRNFFKLPISWFDEASTYCMVYMALIGTELGLRDGTQIAVTALVDKLKGKSKQIVEIIAKIVVLIFSSTILISAFKMVGKQIETGQTSAALGLSMAVPYAALVISFIMIVLVQAITTFEMVVNMIRETSEKMEVQR